MCADVAIRGIHQHPVPPAQNRQQIHDLSNAITAQSKPNPVSSDHSEDLTKMIADLEKKATQRQKCADQSKCVQMTTDLVELFGSTIIFPALKTSYKGPLKFADWHNQLRRLISLSYVEHLALRRKEQIRELMLCMEKLADEKGISRDHWNSLIYLNATTQPSRENIKKSYFSGKQLQHLKHLATDSLEKKLSDTVHVLVDAVEKHVYNSNN